MPDVIDSAPRLSLQLRNVLQRLCFLLNNLSVSGQKIIYFDFEFTLFFTRKIIECLFAEIIFSTEIARSNESVGWEILFRSLSSALCRAINLSETQKLVKT